MLYTEHIRQTCIKNVLEAKLQKTTGIKVKLRKKNIRKEQTRNDSWISCI